MPRYDSVSNNSSTGFERSSPADTSAAYPHTHVTAKAVRLGSDEPHFG